jgi:hypothetical protein
MGRWRVPWTALSLPQADSIAGVVGDADPVIVAGWIDRVETMVAAEQE